MGTTSKKTKTSSTGTATTTPNAPSWVTQPLQGYTTKVSDFLATPPEQYVAPASPLQQQAFSGAQDLGGWKQYADQASNLATTAAGQPAPQVSLTGYNAPQFGAVPQVTAARLGNAPTFDASGIDPTQNAQAFLAQYQDIFDNGGVQKHLDPALESYINPALQAFDRNAGMQRARMEASAAGNKAFGGSRYGVQASEFDANTALGRTQTEAELRRNAYQQAVSQALQEAANRSQVGIFNAGQQTQVSGQNAAAANARASQLSAQEQAAREANAGLQGQYGLRQGDYEQQAGLQTAENQMRAALAQLGINADAAQFGANAQNTQALTNADLQQQAYMRQLQAAGLIGDIGTAFGGNQRADLGLTADLGGQQYAIDQAAREAALKQLQATGQLYGVLPYPQLVGQTINSTENSTSKQSGGLLGGLLSAAASAAAFA